MKNRETLTGKVDFGIITIRDDEYREVLNCLGSTYIVDGKNQRRYRLSSLMCLNGSEALVAVTRCIEQGNVEAQRAASDLIDDLDPKWILVVGIAGGVPDSDFSLGDVVISSRIYDLTLEAANPAGEREYSIKGESLHDLAQRIVQDIPGIIANELTEWHSRIDMKRPVIDLTGLDQHLKGDDVWKRRVRDSVIKHFSQSRLPVALPGAIASSDRLVKDPEITAGWKRVARHIKAIEMELAGVCRQVRNTPVLGIRGISDIIGLQREEIWTTYACKAAAAFAVSLIYSGQMPIPKPPVDVHATALELSLSRDYGEGMLGLWATNQGTHYIQDIEISAIPDAEDWFESTHGPLPKLRPSGAHGVKVTYPIVGAWFFARVDQLNPNRGLMIASFQLSEGDFTRMDFDNWWNDHTGKQRKSHGVADVGTLQGNIPLKPRPSSSDLFS